MRLIEKLKTYKKKQDFFPDFLGLVINPFYFARKGLLRGIKELSTNISGKILDVGCGQKPYESLFQVEEYIGMDIEVSGHDHATSKVDVFYDGKVFPFDEESFDCVLTNQVLEHVFNPSEFLGEIERVLKSDGKLLLTVPFVWDEHEQPYDYARYSSFGLSHLLKDAGFKVIEFRKSTDDVRVIFQLMNAYLHKVLISKSGKLSYFFRLIFVFPANLIGEFLFMILPKNRDLYLDNIILAQKIGVK